MKTQANTKVLKKELKTICQEIQEKMNIINNSDN